MKAAPSGHVAPVNQAGHVLVRPGHVTAEQLVTSQHSLGHVTALPRCEMSGSGVTFGAVVTGRAGRIDDVLVRPTWNARLHHINKRASRITDKGSGIGTRGIGREDHDLQLGAKDV
eukprot:906496-Rhodomonas_salina.3